MTAGGDFVSSCTNAFFRFLADAVSEGAEAATCDFHSPVDSSSETDPREAEGAGWNIQASHRCHRISIHMCAWEPEFLQPFPELRCLGVALLAQAMIDWIHFRSFSLKNKKDEEGFPARTHLGISRRSREGLGGFPRTLFEKRL